MEAMPEGFRDGSVGLVIVDHGSRRQASNQGLLEVVAQFRAATGFPNVEPAHMELAEPSLATAFDRCVAQGAGVVVVHPYFLLPGRHWETDIPRLTAAAASRHPGVRFLVTAPLGIHPLMNQIMLDRTLYCWQHADGNRPACPVCAGSDSCAWQTSALSSADEAASSHMPTTYSHDDPEP
jgi:sirohydrochlorin ferrochelatase